MKKKVYKKILIFIGVTFLPMVATIMTAFGLYSDNDIVINISISISIFGLIAIAFIFLVPQAIFKQAKSMAMPPKSMPKNKKKREIQKEEEQKKILKSLDRCIIIFGIHGALCILMSIVLVILRFTYFA